MLGLPKLFCKISLSYTTSHIQNKEKIDLHTWSTKIPSIVSFSSSMELCAVPNCMTAVETEEPASWYSFANLQQFSANFLTTIRVWYYTFLSTIHKRLLWRMQNHTHQSPIAFWLLRQNFQHHEQSPSENAANHEMGDLMIGQSSSISWHNYN